MSPSCRLHLSWLTRPAARGEGGGGDFIRFNVDQGVSLKYDFSCKPPSQSQLPHQDLDLAAFKDNHPIPSHPITEPLCAMTCYFDLAVLSYFSFRINLNVNLKISNSTEPRSEAGHLLIFLVHTVHWTLDREETDLNCRKWSSTPTPTPTSTCVERS